MSNLISGFTSHSTSKFRIFVLAISALAFSALLPADAGARSHGGRHGGGMHAGNGHASVRPPSTARINRAFTARSFEPQNVHGPAGSGPHSFSTRVRPSPNLRTASQRRSAGAVHQALNFGPANRALRTQGALHDPRTRALVTASIATAALQGSDFDRGDHGWWQHRNGGYGWVGPVFWPFAFYDMTDYALWGYGYDTSFWEYGYPDIYAGLFGPYAYDDLAGYAGALTRPVAPPSSSSAATGEEITQDTTLVQMCGEDDRNIAGLPVDLFRNAMQLNDAQAAALNDLARASEQASQTLKASCPTTIALTAPGRLAVMQQRIEAMSAAVKMVQPPLDAFIDQLTDEQKAQLTALVATRSGRRPRPTPAATSVDACVSMQAGPMTWPAEAIEQSVQPTEAQRKPLDALQAATTKAADTLKASCQPADALTPSARLTTIGQRLDVMLQAVKTVSDALNGFYASLTDEQKANFDVIGAQVGITAQANVAEQVRSSENVSPRPTTVRRRHHRVRYARHGLRAEHVIRRMLFSFIR